MGHTAQHHKHGSTGDPTEAPERYIIVGAGTAGLTVAEELQKAGKDYVILEGRDRIGGRVHTLSEPMVRPTQFELGAAWFHDVPHNRVAYIAEENGIEAGYDDDQTVVYDSQGKLDQTLVNNLSQKFEEFRKSRDESDSLESVLTLFASRQDNEEDKRTALAIGNAYQLLAGLRLEQISAHFHGPPGRDQAVQGGYVRVISDIFAKDVDRSRIEYKKKVTYIDSPKEGDRVQVSTEDGSHYVGKAVIVTVPIGVLKKDTIQFSPALNGNIRKAINSLEVAHINKVYLTFPSSFWNSTTFRWVVSDKTTPALVWNWEATHPGTTEKNTLAVLVTNEDAYAIEKNPESAFEIVKPILEVIAHGDVPEPERVYSSHWVFDEFSEGSFSAIPHGQTREDLAKPFEDGEPRNRLIFAGEHATVEGAGLVQGAWLSGQRAAKQALEL